MRIVNHVIKLTTSTTLDFIDITEKVQQKIKKAGVKNGIINVQSLHTTMAVIVNEAEPLLIMDMKKLLKKLAPRTYKYMHDNFKIRTVHMHPNESKNGHSHVKAMYLPTSTMLNVSNSKLQLGEWQRIFAIELDDSRKRQIALQIIGE
ncbi:MAG TPA: secondary thiamine-phosphate synthase enzyme YjbQ [Candidatus Moranbacteria bacterium]|nr:secondary thiamine-phosphate synthase enzyme YjbQ [Candidatus Moranbacteria bacterium]